ncbi:MAG: hypothetical protein IH840_13225 [Candidatus Heimdallarchaeota archaeon]|nr:hypothetical protein [Candidatus Heimdallarchaeota archaeon]
MKLKRYFWLIIFSSSLISINVFGESIDAHGFNVGIMEGDVFIFSVLEADVLGGSGSSLDYSWGAYNFE